MSHPTDTEVRAGASRAMDRYARGDQAAFAELYDLLAPPLWRFAMNLSRHRAMAEDVVQQTFLQIHRARERWILGANVFSWAHAIAHNIFLDMVRSGRPEKLADGDGQDGDEPTACEQFPEQALDDRRLLDQLLEQIAFLPERYRIAFQLVVIEELTHAEAAEVLGITPNNVKQRVFRARQLLKRRLPGGRR
jgi:RNA polymerase sigma-70 factor (ECF subfamily)